MASTSPPGPIRARRGAGGRQPPGARALSHSNGNSEQPKTANPAPATEFRGPIVMGTVDSEPSPVPYLLPPVLQSGTVAKVFVRGGQEVKVGDPLYEFDTAIQNADLESHGRGRGIRENQGR